MVICVVIFVRFTSIAAEDEKLTLYAHQHSIELLTDLERMKKEILINKKCVDEISECEDSLSESEHDELLEALGVIKKATIERPHSGRIKGIGEKFKKKAPARKRLLMKVFV